MSWTRQQIQCSPTPFMWVGEDKKTPDKFSGLLAWLEADSYALADDTSVFGTGKQWVDQSGNGNHVVDRGGGAGSQPKFRTNQVNGLPAIVGNGSSQFGWIGASGSLALGNTNWTVIVVTSGLPPASTQYICGRSPGDSRFQRRGSSNDLYLPFQAGAQSDGFSAGIGATQMMTYMVRAGVYKFFEGKTERTNATPITATVPVSLNLVMHDGVTATLNGKLAAVIIYNQSRTNAEMTQLHDGYLKPKYALP